MQRLFVGVMEGCWLVVGCWFVWGFCRVTWRAVGVLLCFKFVNTTCKVDAFFGECRRLGRGVALGARCFFAL